MKHPSSAMLLVIVTVCASFLPYHSAAAENAPPRPVIWMNVAADRSEALDFAGVVQPRVETELAFRALGRVIARQVEIGDVVMKGDILAEIDPLTLKLAVLSAQADLRNANAQLENAAINERRKRMLAATNTASAADLELAEQGLKSAEANVTKAQANLAKTNEQLGYARIEAEFDGVITSTSVEVGQTVTAGQSVLKLARLDQRDVVIDVPEAQVSSIGSSTRVDIALQLDDRLRTSGRVREIAPQADTDTRTYRVKIALDTAPDVFRFGAVVTATFTDGRQAHDVVLPRSAIVEKDGVPAVWVIDPHALTVSARAILLNQPGPEDPLVRVSSGLNTNESVVVAGVSELQEGQKIRLGQELRQ